MCYRILHDSVELLCGIASISDVLFYSELHHLSEMPNFSIYFLCIRNLEFECKENNRGVEQEK